MKLRLKGNTVRLRLAAEEVSDLAAGGSVVEALAVGDDGATRWSYGIAGSDDVDELSVRLSGAGLAVIVPREALERWAASSDEGLYGDFEGVRVAVEKDRGCEHPEPRP